ncbi:uncharacterized protein BO96DRAFT_349616 [Aspergillus niger CBS 101883]|uniref:Uncharacterized protein n=2 Tax=Aspergillus niger TaxID=5061 RepID=A2R6E4_ASPNC|nr:uncharacterized protein BO96DRAFT_349616 [Aspergillus niger CBS 101883]XP_059602639.1 hypothetical protein An15g07650 [Aspergillus niger]PYH51699.1 hypothetical protein BO96DRAFT_349616 [Aspergillus niger CBS 101883]CAK42652.1 hypothetical protein An15g07650 [Aspergillus niger]
MAREGLDLHLPTESSFLRCSTMYSGFPDLFVPTTSVSAFPRTYADGQSGTSIPDIHLASTPCVSDSLVVYGEEGCLIHVTSTGPSCISDGYYMRRARRLPLLGPSVAVPALDGWSIQFNAYGMEVVPILFETDWELPVSQLMEHFTKYILSGFAHCKTAIGRQEFVKYIIDRYTPRQDAETAVLQLICCGYVINLLRALILIFSENMTRKRRTMRGTLNEFES